MEKIARIPTQSNHVHILQGRASPSYIIEGEFLAAVDVCFPSDARNMLTFARRTLNRDAEDIRLLVLTHSHLDHINGVDCLVSETKAAIAAHPHAQAYLAGKRAIPVAQWHKLGEFAGFMARHGLPRPSIRDALEMPWAGIPGIRRSLHSRVAYALEDGQDLPGFPGWTVIHTPGHTDDSICIYDCRQKALFTGDTIINLRGRLVLNPLLVLDRKALVDSFKRLRQLHVDALYPGWGLPVFGRNLLDGICASAAV